MTHWPASTVVVRTDGPPTVIEIDVLDRRPVGYRVKAVELVVAEPAAGHAGSDRLGAREFRPAPPTAGSSGMATRSGRAAPQAGADAACRSGRVPAQPGEVGAGREGANAAVAERVPRQGEYACSPPIASARGEGPRNTPPSVMVQFDRSVAATGSRSPPPGRDDSDCPRVPERAFAVRFNSSTAPTAPDSARALAPDRRQPRLPARLRETRSTRGRGRLRLRPSGISRRRRREAVKPQIEGRERLGARRSRQSRRRPSSRTEVPC